jgi:VIT1/CCC1 family predicted Fe2+/Mn2+ transporter
MSKHRERHFTGGELIRDIVIGMSDGLTVPFALAAGLSSASMSNNIISTAGLAEIAAGAIAMGLGGYLAARSDVEHYDSEFQRELKEIRDLPEEEKREVRAVFREYGLTEVEMNPIVEKLSIRPDDWVKFMMKFELGIEKPDSGRARGSAITIAVSYIIGGIIPLMPYFFIADSQKSLLVSAVETAIALYLFGFAKGKFVGLKPFKSALQTLATGSLAALAAFGVAKLVR